MWFFGYPDDSEYKKSKKSKRPNKYKIEIRHGESYSVFHVYRNGSFVKSHRSLEAAEAHIKRLKI